MNITWNWCMETNTSDHHQHVLLTYHGGAIGSQLGRAGHALVMEAKVPIGQIDGYGNGFGGVLQRADVKLLRFRYHR
eukprot:scaffold637_cov83-Cyclotella_meneghiniana.AAC.3